jgi:ligand-binding sensor domain-containing protein
MKTLRCLFLVCAHVLLLRGTTAAQWVQTNGPGGGDINSFALDTAGTGRTKLYVGTGAGVFLSTDSGNSWKATNFELAVSVVGSAPNRAGGMYVFAGNLMGLSRSSDYGASWTDVSAGLTGRRTSAFASRGEWLFIGTDCGVFRSSDDGSTWTAANKNITTAAVWDLRVFGTTLFAATDLGLFLSNDDGATWTWCDTGWRPRTTKALAFSPAGNGDTLIFVGSNRGVLRSTDKGLTWSASGLTDRTVTVLASAPRVTGGSITFACATNERVLQTFDNGITWTPVTNGLSDVPVNTVLVFPGMEGAHGLLLGSERHGIFRLNDDGTKWLESNTGLTNAYVDVLAVAAGKTGRSTLFAGGLDLFLSHDGGGTWKTIPPDVRSTQICSIAASDSNLFVGTTNGLFRSNDTGVHWTPVNNGLPMRYNSSLVICPDGNGGELLVAAAGEVYLSYDNGEHWTASDSGLSGAYIQKLAVARNASGGADILAVSIGTMSGVYLSTDYGASWVENNTGMTSTWIDCIGSVPDGNGSSIFFAGTDDGVYYSSDRGRSWIIGDSGITLGTAFCSAGSNVFCGTERDGVFLSTNHGRSWSAMNDGLSPYAAIGALDVGSDHTGTPCLFAGTRGHSVWRRPLSEMISPVERIPPDIPSTIGLDQNYPNPFGGASVSGSRSTTIPYAIPRSSSVTLTVHDLMGREIARLVDEEKQPGRYSVLFDADGWAAGIYVFWLRAGDFAGTKKCVVMK